MANREIRIFIQKMAPYNVETWAETLLGRIIKPMVDKYESDLTWFWFTRYILPLSQDMGSCTPGKIPLEFSWDSESNSEMGLHKSIRFRYSIDDAALADFEMEARRLVESERCCVTDWLDWDLTEELSTERFIGEDRSEARCKERAELVVSYLHSLSRLLLHALVDPQNTGDFRFENNAGQPLDSSLVVLHHLAANMMGISWFQVMTDKGSKLARAW